HKAVKQSDGSYKVRIESNQHKQDFGAYHSHVYYVTNQNKREYVTATKVVVPEPKTSVRVENITVVGFDVTIKGLATNPDVREVLVPTWTTNKGQDDLI
ncbi:N-acetylmuramidase, partial [Streptococcus danieliae]|nr:N-acetylmuramidase [Streptococcus danieliae]